MPSARTRKVDLYEMVEARVTRVMVAMCSKDVAMSAARPAVMRALALVSFALLMECCMDLLEVDSWYKAKARALV